MILTCSKCYWIFFFFFFFFPHLYDFTDRICDVILYDFDVSLGA